MYEYMKTEVRSALCILHPVKIVVGCGQPHTSLCMSVVDPFQSFREATTFPSARGGILPIGLSKLNPFVFSTKCGSKWHLEGGGQGCDKNANGIHLDLGQQPP